MPVSTVSSVAVLTNQQERDQINQDATITPGVVTTDRNDQRVAAVAQTAIALASPPASLTANADTTLTWNTTSGETYSVRRVYVQNKSTTDCFLDFDTAATAGAIAVRAGTEKSIDAPCNALHIWCSVALAVGGTADGNLVVRGWL